MTDQQTSRTNITEALPKHRPIPTPIPDDEHGIYLTCLCGWQPDHVGDEWLQHLYRVAEPRSDAVTAPDEPSTADGRTLLDVLHAVRVSGMSIRQCIVAIEREARAASASVPPLDDVIEAASDAVLQQAVHPDAVFAVVPRAAMNRLATAVNAYNHAAETPEPKP